MPFLGDFSKTAKKVLEEATYAAAQARKAAGELTDANRDKIEAAIDKAGRAVDTKTEGKYGSTIAKAKGAAVKSVDFVAKQKSTTVPPRPASPGASTHGTTPGTWGPSATWQDDSIQDTVQDRPRAAGSTGTAGPTTGTGNGSSYPNPIPPYEPPTR